MKMNNIGFSSKQYIYNISRKLPAGFCLTLADRAILIF